MMGLRGRVAAYIGLAVVLLIAFDPRTWGQELNTGSHDEIGIVLGAQFLLSAVAALSVLAVVVVLMESAVRSRTQRQHPQGEPTEPEASRSWYE